VRATRLSRSGGAVLVAVVLAGCTADGEGEPSDPLVSEDPAPTEGDDPEPTEPDTTATEEPEDEPSPAPTDEGAPPLSGDPSTEPARSEPAWGGMLAVTEVRVATHDGFDRVVFGIDGDGGTVGWDVRYVDVPTSQGSGYEADVDGAAYLAVSISGVAIPPDLPPDIEVFTDEVDGPVGATIVEVVHDSIYEGYHLFFVGLDAEVPFVVALLDGPPRLVIDLHRG